VRDSAAVSETDVSGLVGTVVAVQANFYQVRFLGKIVNGELQQDLISNCPSLLCTRRSRLKKIGQKIMVGDRVLVESVDLTDGRGAIAQVLPRKNQLERPQCANTDQILLVFALEEPTLDAWQLSKFLVKAESTGIELCLCLNKSDLVSSSEEQKWRDRLYNWGYNPLFISVATQKGIREVMSHLEQKITVVAGPSGVGKSSLIDGLIPNAKVRVGKVSGKLQRGRHTTRHVELFELPGSGLLADSPGFNQPDLDLDPANLALYFPEARKRLAIDNCQFSNCLHRDEPNCSVRGDWERYDHYLRFLEMAMARVETIQQRPDEEANLKLKIKGSGERKHEPRLEVKKYRRSSRRQKHQTLQESYRNLSLEEISEPGEEED